MRPLRDFLRTQAAGGVLLLVGAAAAMAMANSPWKHAYQRLWEARGTLSIAGHTLSLDLRHWVNDGLMTLFFFVVGLEINRELNEGELKNRRHAALPVIAAVGGMVVPAVLFLLVNHGSPGSSGWGIPMATDIAMAVGVLALLGDRVHPSLKLYLLALAIVDDIGAIVVIAVFYSSSVDTVMLGAAAALIVAVVAARKVGVTSISVYVVLGVALWLCTHEAGVHATLAGVVMGLLAPTKPLTPPEFVDEEVLADVSTLQAARETVQMARQSVSIVEWLEHILQPWTSYVIVPVFAFANAGFALDGDALHAALRSNVTHGVIVGLVVGKAVGISVASWLAVRLGAAVLPDGVTWRAVFGVALLGGMGFTVSLFVSALAFTDDATAVALESQAKLGVLAATAVAGILGYVTLRRTSPATEVIPSAAPANASTDAASP